MPLNMAKAMADCLREATAWIEREADLLERGEVVRLQDEQDVSRDYAVLLRHKARNMKASAMGFERVMAKQGLAGPTPP